MKKWPIVALVVSFVFLLGIFLGSACIIPVPVGSPRQGGSSASAGLANVEQAWNDIFKNYVDKSKLDPAKLSQGAIRGMLEALNDPYTTYLDPQTYTTEMHQIAAKYEGIGAYVGTKGDQTVVISTIPGSPAEKGNVKAGDVILQVDGKSISGMTPEQAVQLIRGAAGSTVVVTVRHEGATDPVDITLTRAAIQVKTVNWEMKGDIAYVRIARFSEPTSEEFDDAANGILEEQSKGNARAMILDLRMNPGGLLDSVVGIASHFFDDGVVLYVVDKDGKRTERNASPNKEQLRMPIVILVDEYSASGSEVLAGALRDRLGATIVGHQTFGKGSVNQFRKLPDGGALYITISRWQTPNGTLIEGKGLAPDIPSDLHGNDMINWAIDYLHQKAGASPVTGRRPVPVG
ncbi:MAG: S41 family peptidase [Dehalococcoidia bacterium]|nr:S41 family peptidase [Dehalococcoidia bacterium]